MTGREAKNYRFAMLREASSTVINFICALQFSQLQEFWLSCTSSILPVETDSSGIVLVKSGRSELKL